MAWDEKGRGDDHDTLIEVVQILKAHVNNFSEHTKEDKRQFDVLNRNMYVAIGAVAALNILFKFIGR